MGVTSFCVLRDRAVVRVAGADAHHFLQSLVTSDLDVVRPAEPGTQGRAAFAALLTPQGKILFDFLVAAEPGGGFLVDIAAASVAAFVKRLAMYRLRAKVDIAALGDDMAVVAAWGGAPPQEGVVFADPRLADLGFRALVAPDRVPALAAAGAEDVGEEAYHAHRIALGVPEGGRDFAFGDVFPHDVDMDCLSGVDFTKGCYVGQEVVSRMEHRGTARRRFVRVAATGIVVDALPPAGTEISAAGRSIGILGSSAGPRGLALVRLDRAAEVMAAGEPILAGETVVALTLPAFARFEWPPVASASAGEG